MVYLSQTKVELEFNEIRALSISDTEFQLVYTDSKEYTCDLRTRVWDITVHNLDNNLIDPGIYTRTPSSVLQEKQNTRPITNGLGTTVT